MRYLCCDERRRGTVAGRTDLNGLAFLDVVDRDADPLGPMLVTLVVRFINPAPLPPLSAVNVVITGGGSIRGIRVVSATMRALPDGPALVVTTDRAGDFSVYQLTLVSGPGSGIMPGRPPPGMDPVLSSIDFSFRPGCDSDFDVATPAPCPPGIQAAPPIDYMARDYLSLRQLMLDRVAVLGAPMAGDDAADLGVTLVELLAAVGDELSYRQDAIATEAALHTARQRISARRHARLVDYVMHDGCNARAWVSFGMGAGAASVPLPAGTPLLTRTPGLPGTVAPGDTAGNRAWAAAVAAGAPVFETMEAITLHPELDRLRFHAWGGEECCLPVGATAATLRGDLTAVLAPGRVLVIREALDPATGDPLQANPAHRCAVRLTGVVAGLDPIGRMFDDPPVDAPLAVTEVTWAADDALPFPVCVSARLDTGAGGDGGGGGGGSVFVRDVSVASGNVVLADHGMTLPGPEALGTVPAATLSALAADRPVETLVDAPNAAACSQRLHLAIPPRFTPLLAEAPLTHAAPYDPAQPAAAATRTAPADARPAVLSLLGTEPGQAAVPWTLMVPDLVEAEEDTVFTVETDNAGRGRLRFGDGTRGLRPPESAAFQARYRVGNGTAGNVGAGTIAHVGLASAGGALAGVALVPGNPMPATGGMEPESIESVRRRAPAAFRVQERAVTPADYAALCGRQPGVQRAVATLRWTGSWYTHVVAADRRGSETLDTPFAATLTDALEPFRLAGHDVRVTSPVYVPLELELSVRVAAGQFRAAVRQALGAILNAAPGGMFDPDRFTFGQAVFLSPVLAAVQDVPGVNSVAATAFRRYRLPATDAVAAGVLPLAANEIARLDDDPSFPDHGVLRLVLAGGR